MMHVIIEQTSKNTQKKLDLQEGIERFTSIDCFKYTGFPFLREWKIEKEEECDLGYHQ
jgi:hypothetical protein